MQSIGYVSAHSHVSLAKVASCVIVIVEFFEVAVASCRGLWSLWLAPGAGPSLRLLLGSAWASGGGGGEGTVAKQANSLIVRAF